MLHITATPTLKLRPRDAASSTTYETDSNGNLICSSQPTCPVCPEGQECYQQALTPTSCARYVCVDKESSSGLSVPVGGIVGGVIGGLFLVAALAAAYYLFVYRKKHPKLADDLPLSEFDAQGADLTGHLAGDSHLGEKMERPAALRAGLSNSVTKNHRLLAYESFMRPQARYTKRTAGGRPGANSAPNGGPGSIGSAGAPGSSVYNDNDMSKRNSVATTISTTNASNILPIAYIPGVTIRPTKNNTRSIYSYDTDLVFSDMNAIENASIVADRANANQKSTMTAIRAQPKLVNVARIDEDDEDEDDDVESHRDIDDLDDTDAWDDHIAKDLSVGTALYTVNTLSVNGQPTSEGESDPDSDVDSDIVEIGRATSTRRPREVLVDVNNSGNLINLDQDQHLDHDHDQDQDQDQESGSFILDISGPR